jgi:hypothetical protein
VIVTAPAPSAVAYALDENCSEPAGAGDVLSLSAIETTATTGLPAEAPVKVLSDTLNVSTASTSVSSVSAMEKDFGESSPSAHLSVPETGW